MGCALALVTNTVAAQTPNFGGALWNRGLGPYDPPSTGAGPVQNPPDMPFVFRNNRSNYIGDTTNPILQPWAAERIRAQTQKELDGHQAGTSQQTCRPSGVPGILYLNDLVQIVQRPDLVIFLYARGHQWRIVHLDAQHPTNLTPSWYGNSTGRYEGDTLVVDTIGLNDKPWADRYGTPQTNLMHVVERYRLTPDPHPPQGQEPKEVLEVQFTITDPGAFTMPWSALTRYRQAGGTELDEQICQENNRELGEEIRPLVPHADYKYPY
jgi:hypothetical protein